MIALCAAVEPSIASLIRVTEIGTGIEEQILRRDYHHLGTQLPLTVSDLFTKYYRRVQRCLCVGYNLPLSFTQIASSWVMDYDRRLLCTTIEVHHFLEFKRCIA